MQSIPNPAQLGLALVAPWARALTIISVLSVAACAPTPEEPPTPSPEREAPDVAELERQAQRRADAGELQEAARLYLRLAERARPPRRQHHQLKAATLLWRAEQLTRAGELVDEIDERHLPPSAQARRRLLAARIALSGDAPEKAVAAATTPSGKLAAEVARQLHEVRARAYHAAGEPLASLRERVALHELLASADERRHNATAVWRILSETSDEDLHRLRNETTSPGIASWVNLALLNRVPPLQTDTYQRLLAHWQQANPEHPGNLLIEQILDDYRNTIYRPQQIALLLPLHGRFAQAAAAVRDGFLAAYYAEQDPERALTIKIYDIGEDPHRAWSEYFRAVEEGADFVVGPLDKAATRTLADAAELTVPVLALNSVRMTEPPPKSLFQFGLLPEDEAEQIAAYARGLQHEEALVLVPDSSWGERVATAFREHFEGLGGTVLETQRYDSEASDYSEVITRLLNIDESETRYRQLRRALRRDLEFDPRRRQDADMVFLGAFPRHGRLIRPQLRFHRAAELPLYATSHVYTGTPNPDADQDMDGVLFCDMPWTLAPERTLPDIRDTISRVRGQSLNRFPRLYAMGADAYNVIPYLRRLRQTPFRRYEGASGRLYVNDDGHIHRRLICARFNKGKPNVVGQSLYKPIFKDESSHDTANEPRDRTGG